MISKSLFILKKHHKKKFNIFLNPRILYKHFKNLINDFKCKFYRIVLPIDMKESNAFE